MEALHRDGATLTVMNRSVDVRRAGREAVEASEVFRVIDRAIEILLSHLEKGGGCEQAVTSSLVLLTDPADLKIVCNVLKATFQGLAAPHEKLDVIDAWEPNAKERKKVGFLGGQRAACDHLEQVAKVVAAVERNPLHIVEKRQAGGNEEFSKMLDFDTHPFMAVKVKSGFGEEVQRVGGTHVVVDAESEVELPCADVGRQVTVLVAQCDAELNEFEQVDVTAQRLVVVVRRTLECAYWPRNDTWEFGVLQKECSPRESSRQISIYGLQMLSELRSTYHCNIGILLDRLSQQIHFDLQILSPYFSYSCRHLGVMLWLGSSLVGARSEAMLRMRVGRHLDTGGQKRFRVPRVLG